MRVPRRLFGLLIAVLPTFWWACPCVLAAGHDRAAESRAASEHRCSCCAKRKSSAPSTSPERDAPHEDCGCCASRDQRASSTEVPAAVDVPDASAALPVEPSPASAVRFASAPVLRATPPGPPPDRLSTVRLRI